MLEVTVRGLTLSKLTLGTVQLGIPYGIANKSGKPDDTTSSAILETALAGGINCFDTANVYGSSEQVLGRFFEHRERPLIVTKMHIKADASSTPLEVERSMVQNLELSLSNLQLSKLPVMMVHNPQILAVHGQTITQVAKRLIKDGLMDRMGVSFSVHTQAEFDDMWLTVKDDVYEAVQIPINILDTRLLAYGGLKSLDESGKIVFARSIFLQGLLFMEEQDLPAHLRDAAEPLRTMRAIAAQEGLSVAQLAVSFIRDLPQIHSIVFGAETPEQVRDNLELFHGPAISETGRAAIIAKLANLPEHIVNPVRWAAAAN
ncbi:MAG: aldo/keto reductase [Paenibacillus sp.]|nr:aldo/keto reductase [Paenibacillus sp.]